MNYDIKLVSILIPAFNAQSWIADTIKSAIGQTWPHKEIIIVDDGSTDQTLSIARQFESNVVRVFSQRNQGASAARNHAFRLSRGDYIQWLDADDLLSHDKVEKQMHVAGNVNTLISSGWGYFTYRTSCAKFSPTPLWQDLFPKEWMTLKLEKKHHMQTATWLVSRELTEAAGPWDTRLLSDDDGEYFCRVIMASDRILFVPESKVFYRITSSSRLSYIGQSDKKKDALFLSMQLHIQYILSLDDSERVRMACVTYIQNYLIVFYPDRMDIVDSLKRIAEGLGGNLRIPKLRWKYDWIRPIAGWNAAKRTQDFLPLIKGNMMRFWDNIMYNLS